MRRVLLVLFGLLISFLCFAGTSYAANYTVKPGDTLYLIARKFGITTQQLMSANGLTGNTIYPGQVFYIPTGNNTYTVQPGDTLYLIARAKGTTVDALKSANGLSRSDIYPGQVLTIPSTSGSEAYRGSNSSQDAYLLAQLIYAEARGEPFEGQVAVGAVVLNRVKDSRFPNSISGVIYDPWQFETVQDGQIYMTPDTTARRAADAALTGWDPTGGALYFYNPAKADGSFFKGKTYLCTIGNHAFYK